MNPDAMAIARKSDLDRSAGLVRGLLHGIPFILKDKIASEDQLATTAGSLALQGSVVSGDAFVVAQLRKAGAVLMGRITLSELADARRQARSSYNLTVNPGGSSSGSAIAVANNLVPSALGTETDESVINPAERNTIVGIIPTMVLVSRGGVIPESIHQDTVGTFGRSVQDAVYALDAIYAVGKDAGAIIINGTEMPSYQDIVSPSGWNWHYSTGRGYPNESEYTYIKVDFYNNFKSYMSGLSNTTIKSLADIVHFNNEHALAE
ncbi:MAG: hypothetical protein Q9210_003892, partial [Variospora velana]